MHYAVNNPRRRRRNAFIPNSNDRNVAHPYYCYNSIPKGSIVCTSSRHGALIFHTHHLLNTQRLSSRGQRFTLQRLQSVQTFQNPIRFPSRNFDIKPIDDLQAAFPKDLDVWSSTSVASVSHSSAPVPVSFPLLCFHLDRET